MVWCAFSYRGTELQVVQLFQNAARYMLERSSLFTEGSRLCGENWIFQQDNAAIHIARKSKDFIQAHSIHLFHHPSSIKC